MPSERGNATRERLLTAAAELVGEVGWGSVSTRMVAERAGVNPGVVHYHFSSVPELLQKAAVGYARAALGQSLQELVAYEDVADGIAYLLRQLGSYTATDPTTVLLTEAFLAAVRMPGLRADLRSLLDEFRNGVTDWLRARGAPGDVRATAAALAAAADGVVLHHGLDPDLDLRSLAEPLSRMAGFPATSGPGRNGTR